MKIKVIGGTHLGIVGLHRERIFDVSSADEIETLIREQFDLKDAIKDEYMQGATKTHTLTDKDGLTLFEYVIEEVIP